MSELLLLGDDRLYEVCEPVGLDELDEVPHWIELLKQALLAYRETYGAGRAIAAPQLGISRRLIVMLYQGEFIALINPTLRPESETIMRVWDDCMCMPGLFVEVERYSKIRVDYIDAHLEPRFLELEGDYAELVQHEYDHLDGILMTMRAIDEKSFKYKILR